MTDSTSRAGPLETHEAAPETIDIAYLQEPSRVRY